MASSTVSTTEERPQSCSGCSWCEGNKDRRFATSVALGRMYTSKEACFAIQKFLKAVVSSPDGLVKEDEWNNAQDKCLFHWKLMIEYAIEWRWRHEEQIQMQRRTLFLRQQQQSSPLGSALFNTFPVKLLKHIASYLAKPSQALFAVSLGNFDTSSIAAMSTVTNRFGGQKRNSDGSLREETSTVSLPDMPPESLGYILSFIPEFSQAAFNLTVAFAKDELLNKNSFAIVYDQCWENLDFGDIEKELAARLTDDDIRTVLWCIGAAYKVKRLSLANCVNITGTCLEPLGGSVVIEQIDLSLVDRHESPTLLELWHPPQKIDFVAAAFDPPLSCEKVLPILDSIIGLKQCSLQHLQFPQAWREKCQVTLCYRSKRVLRRRGVYDSNFKPDPAFVSFLSRYNQVLMNRMISCVKCTRNLPSSGYELVGSIFGDERESFFDERENVFTFGNQNHTCSQCMKHYCYRCDGRQSRRYDFGEFALERCDICEKDQCGDCSRTYCCIDCHNYYCMDCKECTTCSNSWCARRGHKVCSDCDLRQCDKCKKGSYCSFCTSQCENCDVIMCECCDDFIECPHCLNKLCGTCASERFDTCQQCKNKFCGDDYECYYTSECQSCNQIFCQDCVTLPQCDNLVPGSDNRCSGYHCVDCPDESFVELARTCSDVSKEPCDYCRSMESNVNRSHCERCSRMCCKSWQIEKKKLKDDQLNESKEADLAVAS